MCYSDVSNELLADFTDTANLVNEELLGSLITWENAKIIAAITGDAAVLTPDPGCDVSAARRPRVDAGGASGPGHRQCDLVVIHPDDLVSVWGEQDTVGALMAGPAIAVALSRRAAALSPGRSSASDRRTGRGQRARWLRR